MHRLPGLDLLRAIAIVWVMLFHAYALFGLGTAFAWLSGYGWMGVDIFFVLSGFLIGSQVLQPLQRGERLSFGRFYARRAWRILPPLRWCWRCMWVFLHCVKRRAWLHGGSSPRSP